MTEDIFTRLILSTLDHPLEGEVYFHTTLSSFNEQNDLLQLGTGLSRNKELSIAFAFENAAITIKQAIKNSTPN